MGEVTSETVITSLKGISYPTTKNEMIEQARKNNADEDVIRKIESIPREKFRTTVDIVSLFKEESRRRWI